MSGASSSNTSGAPASPSKARGKWLFKKSSSTGQADTTSPPSPQPSKGGNNSCDQLLASPSKQKKGFKFSMPKNLLEKKKAQKKEEDQGLSDKNSSNHTNDLANEFDAISGLPMWEQPNLLDEEPQQPRAAGRPTKHHHRRKQTRGRKTKEGAGTRAKADAGNILESLQLNCDSSNSSISLEDIACVSMNGSSDALVSNRSTLSGNSRISSATGSTAATTNTTTTDRYNMSLPSMSRSTSGNSTMSARPRGPAPRVRRARTNNVSGATATTSYKPPPPPPPPPASSVRSRTLSHNTMNASMDLASIMADGDVPIRISNNDDDEDDDVATREKEMLRMAMERSVQDFGNGSNHSRSAYKPSSNVRLPPSAPRPPPSAPKPRTTMMQMNASMDLRDIFDGDDFADDGVDDNAEDEDDLAEQERKMLEIALHRSVQDVGGSIPMRQTGGPPPLRHKRNVSAGATRHAGMHMSMDLQSVFEEEPSESPHGERDRDRFVHHRRSSESLPSPSRDRDRFVHHRRSSDVSPRRSSEVSPRRDVDRFVHHRRSSESSPRPGYNNNNNYFSVENRRHSYDYSPSERNENLHIHGTAACVDADEDENARLLAEQEEEMIRFAMERSMADVHISNAPPSPRRPRPNHLEGFSRGVDPMNSPTRLQHQPFTYSRPHGRGTENPPSPRRSHSDGSTAGRRSGRGGRRPMIPRPEPF